MDLNTIEIALNRLGTCYGEATRVPIQTFVETVLPSLPSSIDFDALVRTLETCKGPTGKMVTKNGRLWGYSAGTPSQVKSRSPFNPFRVCAEKVAKELPSVMKTCVFAENSDIPRAQRSDICPDVWFRLLDHPDSSKVAPEWHSIAIVGSYEQYATSESIAQNKARVIECMAACMENDPRRRFTYGFSIEDCNMRLWYCDRAQILVSSHFDFTSDYRTLFRFLVSCMLADSAALGFDPTMRRLQGDNGEVQYDILVQCPNGATQTYRTVGVLHDGGEDVVLGRGTRVWRARRVDGEELVGEAVALKDSWVDDHREREGSVDSRIRESALFLESDDRRRLEQCLPTVLAHGDVVIAGVVDRTFSSQSGGAPQSTPKVDKNGGLKTRPKLQTHYRIVYREIGSPLRNETCLATIYKALAEVCGGLYSLHQCSWTHGDISPNNILLCDGQAKLTDFEYARKKEEIVEHDGAGTPFFQPVEVLHHHYLFKTGLELSLLTSPVSNGDMQPLSSEGVDCSAEDPRRAARAARRAARRAEPYSTPKLIIFRYGPLHDLEALWWVSSYFLFARAIVKGPKIDKEDRAVREKRLEAQRSAARNLFCNMDTRWRAIEFAGKFLAEVNFLHPLVRDFGEDLEQARKELVAHYTYVEKDVETREFEVPTNIYNTYRQLWLTMARDMEEDDIHVEYMNIRD